MLVSNFTYDHGSFGSSLIDIVGYYWNLSKESLNLRNIVQLLCIKLFGALSYPKCQEHFLIDVRLADDQSIVEEIIWIIVTTVDNFKTKAILSDHMDRELSAIYKLSLKRSVDLSYATELS